MNGQGVEQWHLHLHVLYPHCLSYPRQQAEFAVDGWSHTHRQSYWPGRGSQSINRTYRYKIDWHQPTRYCLSEGETVKSSRSMTVMPQVYFELGDVQAEDAANEEAQAHTATYIRYVVFLYLMRLFNQTRESFIHCI